MKNKMTIPELLKTDKKVFLVLENIRSAYNVGAMFRTADGAGEIALILAGYTPTPENPKVAKTGLGAEFLVPWAHADDVSELFTEIESMQIPEYGLELAKNAASIYYVVPEFPLVLYVGNEVTGLSVELMTRLESFLMIPMHGEKASLNVAEAASIAMYELYRKLQV